MKEEKIQVFIDGVDRYFNEAHQLGAEIGTPYLVENSTPQAYDYTGIIGISGQLYKGCVYFTAPKVLLRNILLSMEEDGYREENLKDLVGEIANTISGNARSEFGDAFIISVPIVIAGAPDDVYLPHNTHSFVIPLTFKKYHADIVISLQQP